MPTTYRRIPKPSADEYPPYAEIYMSLMPGDGLVLQHLADSLAATRALLGSLSDARLAFRYAPGKWTIKDIVGHLIDDERIYVYRALRFARGDSVSLPGFEQDDYVLASNANERPISDLLDELAAVRASTIAFFQSLPEPALAKRGTADGNESTVRALAYHIAGHERRHLSIIREKYLVADRL